ncbi:MAG: AraC family transcriptional regulator [Alphaproteobacteria bacterium]
MREIIRASAWEGFRKLVTELGGAADENLAAAHVDDAMLVEPDRYLPLRAFIESQEIAAKRLGRPDFGLMFGSRQNLSALGALSIAILNAPTVREAIDICTRYLHIHNPAATMTLTPRPRSPNDFLSLSLALGRPIACDQNSERIIASFNMALGQIGGPDYRPHEVWFTHKPLSPLSVYRRHFGVTPQFGKPTCGIAIARKLLDAWQPGRSPQLRQIAESYLHSIAPPRAATFSFRVANVIRTLLRGGACSPEQAADALGIHARTLQRRLKVENSSFEKIKDDVRREMAEALLAQPSVSLSQIAHMLDYANSSAFSKSARRWFDETPRAHRARLVAGSGNPAPTQPLRGVRPAEAARRARSRLGST